MATPTDDGRVVPTDIVLQFTSIPDCTTCEPVTFAWNYAGSPNLELVLSVTNIGLLGLPEGTPILSQNIARLNGGVLDDTTSFTWDQVNVPEGTYALEAWIAGIPYMSSTFEVINGTDTSCLPNSAPPPSSRPSTSIGTPTSTNTSTGVPIVGAVGDNGGMSGGVIAGIVIAIIAVLGALFGAFVLYRYYRRRNAERRPFSPTRPRSGFFEKGHGNSWRGGSVGAKLVYGGQTPDGFDSRHIDAFGAVGGRTSRHGLTSDIKDNRSTRSTRSSPGASEEDIASLAEEKMVTNAPTSGYDFIAASDLPRLPMRYRSSASSIAESTDLRPRLYTHDSDPFATPRVQQLPVGMYDETLHTPISPAFPQSVSASPASTRRRLSGESARSNLTGLGLSRSSTQSHGIPQTHSHSHSHSHSQSQLLSPPTGKRTMTSRKPVPVYNSPQEPEAHELVQPTTLRSESGSGTQSGSSTHNDWSSTAQLSHTASPSPALSVSSIGETSPVPHIPHPGLPELNHKSSFGDRPVHYLIPDPPPQRPPRRH